METRTGKTLLLFLFIATQVFCFNIQFPDGDGELVFTSILYRHGERSPNHFYPNDPYKNLSFWPDGLGMLTNHGKLEHYRLGQWLRKRYQSLIPDGKYSRDLVYVQSTDVDRTLMSAMANLAGLFYPTQEEMWSDLQWQPIPVHTIPEELDKVLAVGFPCPRIEEEEEAVYHSATLRGYNKEHEKLYKYLSVHTGYDVDEPSKAGLVYTNLLIESLTMSNFTVPDWALSVYPEKVQKVGGVGFALRTQTKTLKRLKGGPLLKEMITHMKEKRSGTLSPDRNLWIYSGHDTTVAPLLDVMGVFNPHMPPFLATVMVELRKDNKNDFFVSVHYKNSTEEPTLLTIPGCIAFCPLDTFESLLSGVIPEDWDQECQNVKSTNT